MNRMRKALVSLLLKEADRLRGEILVMQRSGDAEYETAIRIYRNEAVNVEKELAELMGSK